MTLEIFDAATVRARVSANKLRQFPGATKGRSRLFPYARPEFDGVRIDPATRVFVLGACFGRGIERELRAAGRTVLSSPTNLGLPGSTSEQFQRYNIFNLDVGLNELRWALEGDDAGVDSALLPAGDHLIDTQLSWAFAHDPETARKFRRLYNGSYAAISNADVVVLLTGGVEQWFDREKGVYINSMPGPMAEKHTPGRFELHRIGVDEAKATLTDIMDLVRLHSTTTPQFIIAVSPVSQPMIYGASDALIDQFLAKSVQRLAVEDIVAQHPDARYFPALEAAMWSDFRFTYMQNSPNHTGGNFAARMASDLIAAGEADDRAFLMHRVLAHASAALLGGNASAAVEMSEVVAPLLDEDFPADALETPDSADDPRPVGATGPALLRLHLRALSAAHRRADAYALALSHIRAGHDVDEVLRVLPPLGAGKVTQEERADLARLAAARGLDPAPIEAMWLAGERDHESSSLLQTIEAARREGDHEVAVRLAQELLDGNTDLPPRLRARAIVPLITGLRRLDRASDAIQVSWDALNTPLIENRTVRTTAVRALMFADRDTLTNTIDLLRPLGAEADIAILEKRLKRLDR